MIFEPTLTGIKNYWYDAPEFHKHIHETFCELVNADPDLKAHRDFVEQNAFGFGERSFQWMWRLIVDDMPKEFSFLEIGVFRGQILSLIELLAARAGKRVNRYGVTPLSPIGIDWESDYAKDIETIHDQFNLNKDYKIYKGLSNEPEIIEQSLETAPYDIVFIDGGHDYETVVSDLKHYMPVVKPEGYLVIDDACTDMNMPWGFFQGITEVTKAVNEVLPNKDFEFQFNVVHNRVFKKVL